MMRTVRIALLLAATSHAFVPTQPSSWLVRSSGSSSVCSSSSKKDMEHDIEELKVQAKERLQKLNEQMEDWKHDDDVTTDADANDPNNSKNKNDIYTETATPTTKATRDKKEEDLLASVLDRSRSVPTPKTAAAATAPATTTTIKIQQQQPPARQATDAASLNLLDDTRWRIVFNIGREPNTWMPATWGKSGERLRFHVVVDLTEETLYERDEFFQGIAGAKVLQVVEAWVVPTGVGAASRGRRPIPTAEFGGYKVVPGKGPMGTDVLRLYIELKEQVETGGAGSDVNCPAGRVYGTCGYFAMHQAQATDSQWKDVLADEHRALKTQFEQAQREVDEDANIISWDKMQKMKKAMQLRIKLNGLSEKLKEAREFNPEKSQLRLSRDGKVGLTREGGVCCKVSKGIAVEYHILGKMELASVKHDDEGHTHDEDEDRLNQLRP